MKLLGLGDELPHGTVVEITRQGVRCVNGSHEVVLPLEVVEGFFAKEK
jgi:hypothetical protein